jgi:hypothetical protein
VSLKARKTAARVKKIEEKEAIANGQLVNQEVEVIHVFSSIPETEFESLSVD